MANRAGSSSAPRENPPTEEGEEELIYGGESGWVEARTSCDHLSSLSFDLTHIPTPDTPCHICEHPDENWLCLCCKEVLCSRFVNKHMLNHYHNTSHSLALSYSDLSVWCFSCDAYLDAQVIRQLRPVYETAYLLKFGEAPPSRAV
ncbi:Histone deacetylase 6 [Morus notabilis]|uniref:Histone deacetylase 6 n=1 Tax=Morus notabilis TaxID=981085 RepID=W9R976_9ROSA|nr:histone deacetylase 6 [Morus notabilis]EXB76677.1 Histone deacetylase 6 [Morus notabilis]